METQYSDRETKLFCALCLISNLSFYPLFQQSSYARYLVLGLWGILLFRTILVRKTVPFCNDEFAIEMVLFIFFVACSGITFICGGTQVFSNHFFRVVATAMMILLIGYMNGAQIGKAGLESICLTYMHSMFVISVPLFVFYQKGIEVSSSLYAYNYGKNEIAILLMVAFNLGLVLYTPHSLIGRLYKFGGLAMCLLNLTYLRCRTAILCIIVCMIVLVLLGKSVSRNIKLAICAVGCALLFFYLRYESEFNVFLNNVIYAGRDSGSLDSLSSGRMTQIRKGLEVFLERPFAGVGYRGTLDCFFVSALANYGIGAWSIISLALLPLFGAIKNVKCGEKIDVVFLLVAISMIVTALFEELAPFGTGVRCYVLWLMWGVLLRSRLHDNVCREE